MNREDFFRIGRNRVRITPDASLDAAAIDKPGNALHVVALAGSAMAEECEARSVSRAAAHLSATAVDEDLDRGIAEDTFERLPRLRASAAVISLTVRRSAPGASDGFLAPGTKILVGSATFSIDYPGVAFAAGDIGPFPLSATCTTLGTAGNVLAAAGVSFQRPSELFDPTLSLTAVGDAAGGAEREQDAAYRGRRAAFDAGLDRSVRLVEAAALSVPGIRYAVAVEDVNPQSGELTGQLSLYVADANGRANDALLARVRLGLRGARLGGQTIRLFGASPIFQSIVLRVRVKLGADIGIVQTAVRGAVVAAVNKLRPGDSFQRETLAAAIFAVPGTQPDPLYPFGVVSPATNIAATSSATLFRTAPELVTFG